MTREEARKRARALVEKMTLEEAASQMSYQAPAIERLGVPSMAWPAPAWPPCIHRPSAWLLPLIPNWWRNWAT